MQILGVSAADELNAQVQRRIDATPVRQRDVDAPAGYPHASLVVLISRTQRVRISIAAVDVAFGEKELAP